MRYDRNQFLDMLVKSFDYEELKVLCFRIDLDSDELSGESKTAQFVDLIRRCERLGLIASLLESCRLERPALEWPTLDAMDTASIARESAAHPGDDHDIEQIANSLKDGRLIFFLGSAVNRFPGDEDGGSLHDHPPRRRDIARHLLEALSLRNRALDESPDLGRVSQRAQLFEGESWLSDQMRQVLEQDYPPMEVHRFLAGLSAKLRDNPYCRNPNAVFMTTNYDDALEKSFALAREPYDLLFTVSRGANTRFSHRSPDGRTHEINLPNEYLEVSVDQRPVVVKLHGAFDRADPFLDSFVVTEDQYIGLGAYSIPDLLPTKLRGLLCHGSYVFLGVTAQPKAGA